MKSTTQPRLHSTTDDYDHASSAGSLKAFLRDAEMTTKIIFERSSQKGGRQGVRKEGQQGTHLEILLSGYSTGKTAFWKIAFLLSSLFPRIYSDDNFGQLPPFHSSGGRIRGP